MQIIISILIVGLLWMIYDIINAPEVDDNENYILPLSEEDNVADEDPIVETEIKKLPEIEQEEKVSK